MNQRLGCGEWINRELDLNNYIGGEISSGKLKLLIHEEQKKWKLKAIEESLSLKAIIKTNREHWKSFQDSSKMSFDFVAFKSETKRIERTTLVQSQ